MLTPDEIRVKEFITSLRGYDAEEVRDFLLAIADTMEATHAAPAGTAPAFTPDLVGKITRLTEELELALWTMRRLESAVQHLEERLDRLGGASSIAS